MGDYMTWNPLQWGNDFVTLPSNAINCGNISNEIKFCRMVCGTEILKKYPCV